ncbi:hypothetical protein CYMTET_13495 [Cymbomonas tetramitiformis]|uniref:Uncharacterized protein n=1 Tax=Cymbomonas tetramitiformis TaxID=36881 RepID=A0AAE0GI16_9CHLO|nr:hypothetical protein CYMTET_13495 [Cymbomonas tetramitiformis]
MESARERIQYPELYASMQDELLSNDESAQLRKQEEETEKKRAEQQTVRLELARMKEMNKADGKQQPAKRIHDDTGEGGAPKVARLEAASTAAGVSEPPPAALAAGGSATETPKISKKKAPLSDAVPAGTLHGAGSEAAEGGKRKRRTQWEVALEATLARVLIAEKQIHPWQMLQIHRKMSSRKIVHPIVMEMKMPAD